MVIASIKVTNLETDFWHGSRSLKEATQMSIGIDQVLNAALALPDSDRLELVEAINASLLPQDRPPFDESWRDVILRRSAELESGAVVGIPWEDVKRQSRERTGG
jgi:putative addiction module component (TIGR02574 family)